MLTYEPVWSAWESSANPSCWPRLPAPQLKAAVWCNRKLWVAFQRQPDSRFSCAHWTPGIGCAQSLRRSPRQKTRWGSPPEFLPLQTRRCVDYCPVGEALKWNANCSVLLCCCLLEFRCGAVERKPSEVDNAAHSSLRVYRGQFCVDYKAAECPFIQRAAPRRSRPNSRDWAPLFCSMSLSWAACGRCGCAHMSYYPHCRFSAGLTHCSSPSSDYSACVLLGMREAF